MAFYNDQRITNIVHWIRENPKLLLVKNGGGRVKRHQDLLVRYFYKKMALQMFYEESIAFNF